MTARGSLRRTACVGVAAAVLSCDPGGSTPLPPPAQVASVSLTAPAASLTLGATMQLTAVARDAAGTSLDRTMTWSSSAPATAEVSATGMVTGLAVGGPVTITATSEGVSATTQVSVTPVPVASVSVAPAAATVMVGQSMQLTATARDANNGLLLGRTATWSSGNSSTATVSSTGMVTGVGAGSVTITATIEGVSGTTQITVPPPVASVVVVAPASSMIVGQSMQLTVTLRDAANTVLSNRPVTWTSTNPSVAIVTGNGLVTGIDVGGPVTIAATAERVTGAVSITVAPIPVASVGLAPLAPRLVLGAGLQLTATTRDASGGVLAGREVVWTSSNAAIATVSGTGAVSGVALGQAVITATSEGVSATTTVSVVDGVVTAIGDIRTFLERCPTADTAYAAIRQRWSVLSDGVPVAGDPPCTGPMSTLPIAQLTDELVAWQVARTAYYMRVGTEGRLPWTAKDLWSWMTTHVSGVNLKSASGQLYCCESIDGKLYFVQSRQVDSQREFKRAWPGISNSLNFYIHEIRHADPGSPAHTTGCAAFPYPTDPPGCDATYDLSNLGGYGVQYWIESSWATGFVYIGIRCSPSATANQYLNWDVSSANGFRSRFVTNVPPQVVGTLTYAGACTN